jgi:hypothetical protein
MCVLLTKEKRSAAYRLRCAALFLFEVIGLYRLRRIAADHITPSSICNFLDPIVHPNITPDEALRYPGYSCQPILCFEKHILFYFFEIYKLKIGIMLNN